MTEPLIAALAASSQFSAPEPVPAVSYRSAGRLLVIGPRERALSSAQNLAPGLQVSVLLTDSAPSGQQVPTLYCGKLVSIAGWLGEFEVHWQDEGGEESKAQFDLVLDLDEDCYFRMHQPPQGYFAPSDEAALDAAMAELADAVGEFEKPKFFLLHEKLCAHSRSRLDGCNRCVDVCSTEAIQADDNHVRVEPHLCMGCGACATVCPSGAIRYNYPSMAYWGSKLKAVLAAYAAAGGGDACLLLHDEHHVVETGNMPERVVPLTVFNIASIGLDWLLGAIALGANQVMVQISGDEAPQYIDALQAQMALGEEILQGLGYCGKHFGLVDEWAAISGLERAVVPAEAALFAWFNEKRTTLEFCIDHIVRHASREPEMLALPQGAPFGKVEVAGDKCTLCYSCVSVCPASALQDGAGQPQLNFIERNCIQCGLCERGCPEDAISLVPRLLLTPQAKQKKTLHADQPFHCVRCGKAFGTRSMVLGMTAKLAGHSMFASAEALNRLKMCGDCRVIDMMAVQS